jgi:diaminopimelate decarboxylase/aspartate kinase
MTGSWIVLKFGGTSVSTWERWGVIASRVRQLRANSEHRVMVVASALAGVSDLLDRALSSASKGSTDSALAQVQERHRQLQRQIPASQAEGDLVSELWDQVGRWLDGARTVGEVSARLQARVMACGELASTRLGLAALRAHGIEAEWLDAREILVTRAQPHAAWESQYLEAVVEPSRRADQAERRELSEVVLTQGFIARNQAGETCLLGRGGSDTSAALLAAWLQAERLEIWTDVHGMFTADPRRTPAARLIRRIGYREAQELAALGAKVLHPRAIPPVAKSGIPLLIKNTLDPDREGTLITSEDERQPAVTAVTSRRAVTLLTLDTMEMWGRAGFLADVFGPFKDLGISIDLLATSEAAVSLTLDRIPGGLDGRPFAALLERLSSLGTVRVVHPTAVISIVGRRIRSVMHELAPAFGALGDRAIHLVSQSSEDLNFSVVVDEPDADELVERWHAALFSPQGRDEQFGPTWDALQGAFATASTLTPEWWRGKRAELLELARDGKPRFVYDAATVRARCQQLRSSLSQIDRFYYAMKANPHPQLLDTIAADGFGIECVSAGELARAREAVRAETPLLFTASFAPLREYQQALEAGAELILDGPHTLELAPELFRGTSLGLRIDPGRGRGHHEKVRTAGAHAKFGQPLDELDPFLELAARLDVRIVGLHAHAGSGITDSSAWLEIAQLMASIRPRFPALTWADLGGGLGVVERPGSASLDLNRLNQSLAAARELLPGLTLRLEPGRFLVSEAGVLIAEVTQVRRKAGVGFVGISTGMNSLIRPALYGAWHGIHNLTRIDQPAAGYWHLAGPICESGDLLGRDRLLPESKPGDVILIENAGAYGAAMSSRYNLRPPADELVLE